ncbi:MAG: glycoside hydrolase family 26 protein [Rikenellaceae bacterium]|nr:glycoside hydrolase family 26 protein [Rikenellaceae bacterium]
MKPTALITALLVAACLDAQAATPQNSCIPPRTLASTEALLLVEKPLDSKDITSYTVAVDGRATKNLSKQPSTVDGTWNVPADETASAPRKWWYPYPLVDTSATYSTKSLYASLHKIASGGRFLFGGQDVTLSGYGWQDGDGARSDFETVSGRRAAFFSWDFMNIARPDDVPFRKESDRIRRLALGAFFDGGVNSFCWHFMNPVTGGSFYDTTVRVVERILPGGTHHAGFTAMLDKIAAYNRTLVDRNGEQTPVIFRPWHEMDGNWFWWGRRHCSAEEFKQLYRFTVSYLRDRCGVHNFLYAFSPDCGYNSIEEYLERYPGDEWVDIIATDNYHDFRFEEPDREKAHRKLKIISDYARSMGKVAALSETGQNGLDDPLWFTGRLLKAIKGYPDEPVELAYAALWRNSVHGFWSPYPGHPAEADFCCFTAEPHVIMGPPDGCPDKYYRMDWDGR